MTEQEPPRLPGFREMARRHRRAGPDHGLDHGPDHGADRGGDHDRERRDLLAELVARRRAAGLSQGEVAGRMGTSQPAVARLEAGQVDARMSTVQRYADAIGVRLRLGLGDRTREEG